MTHIIPVRGGSKVKIARRPFVEDQAAVVRRLTAEIERLSVTIEEMKGNSLHLLHQLNQAHAEIERLAMDRNAHLQRAERAQAEIERLQEAYAVMAEMWKTSNARIIALTDDNERLQASRVVRDEAR